MGPQKPATAIKASVALPCSVRHKATLMPDPTLILRRANVSLKGSHWQHEDYDVFDGDREVGRIYLVNDYDGQESWFWGVSFEVTKRKSYGYAPTLDEAKAAFRAEYERCCGSSDEKQPSSCLGVDPQTGAIDRTAPRSWSSPTRPLR
jgi:hypothetical protein